jgi:uncharacterized membrane protein YozB (DUF420 family)/cytochrome oxidase Cu insertion factor (SCO1/SenC/PrrC family)
MTRGSEPLDERKHWHDRLLWGWLVAVGLGVTAWAAWSGLHRSDDLTKITPFQLIDRTGSSVTQRDLSGKVWIAGCTFTCCTLSCPKITEAMTRLNEHLRATNVYLVNFSVDPEHDTPDVLDKYASALGSDCRHWLFLTGDKNQIYQLIEKSFQTRPQANPDPNADAGLRVTHSNRLFLVDQHGTVRGNYTCVEAALGPGGELTNQFHINEEELRRLARDAEALDQGPLGPALRLGWLPALNAVLNGTSAVLMVIGYFFIRRHSVKPHAACMVSAVGVSALFLASYLYYHYFHGATTFAGQGWTRLTYFGILISHTILAVVAAPLVLITVFFAARGRIDRHRRLARWTLPIWLYVSVTGVLVYFFLYHFFAA